MISRGLSTGDVQIGRRFLFKLILKSYETAPPPQKTRFASYPLKLLLSRAGWWHNHKFIFMGIEEKMWSSAEKKNTEAGQKLGKEISLKRSKLKHLWKHLIFRAKLCKLSYRRLTEGLVKNEQNTTFLPLIFFPPAEFSGFSRTTMHLKRGGFVKTHRPLISFLVSCRLLPTFFCHAGLQPKTSPAQ